MKLTSPSLHAHIAPRKKYKRIEEKATSDICFTHLQFFGICLWASELCRALLYLQRNKWDYSRYQVKRTANTIDYCAKSSNWTRATPLAENIQNSQQQQSIDEQQSGESFSELRQPPLSSSSSCTERVLLYPWWSGWATRWEAAEVQRWIRTGPETQWNWSDLDHTK